MDSNKRLKSASGAPIHASHAAANLTAYQPPAAIAGVGAPRPNSSRPTASVTRGANGSSLKLKVRAPSSKLKQVTGASDGAIPPNPYAELSESDATPQPATRTARQTRNTRTVVEPDTDEDEDMEDADGEEDEEEDEEMEDEEEDENEDSEEDAEGEEDGEDELALGQPPPPPIIRQERPPGQIKPNVTVTAPPEGPLKSVEAKEMEDEEDEELSELESNPEADEDEEDDDDSDEDLDNSRSATPDLSKLTKRQRGVHIETEPAELMELSNEAQKKKHLTAEEQVMRRTEMARRRKNLSEKRNEEEKQDTINKLLKKPAPKRRTRAEIIAQQQADMMATPGAEDGEEERADPLFMRWVNNSKGSRIGVPEEWMEAGVGDVFRKGNGMGSGRLVEEVS